MLEDFKKLNWNLVKNTDSYVIFSLTGSNFINKTLLTISKNSSEQISIEKVNLKLLGETSKQTTLTLTEEENLLLQNKEQVFNTLLEELKTFH